MLTLADLRYNGLLLPFVRTTASILSAAAERKIAPTFVGFITFSSIAIRFAPSQIFSSVCNGLRRIAHNIPLVSLKPVSLVKISNSAVYTGNPCISVSSFDLFSIMFSYISLHFSNMFFPSPSICFFSIRQDIGSYPASSALSITLGLSAIKIPFPGSALFNNCPSDNLAYTSSSSASKSLISIMFILIFNLRQNIYPIIFNKNSFNSSHIFIYNNTIHTIPSLHIDNNYSRFRIFMYVRK